MSETYFLRVRAYYTLLCRCLSWHVNDQALWDFFCFHPGTQRLEYPHWLAAVAAVAVAEAWNLIVFVEVMNIFVSLPDFIIILLCAFRGAEIIHLGMGCEPS